MADIIPVIATICLILLSLEIWYRKRPKNYPPGPQTIPILGNMLHLLPNPISRLPSLHEKYGKILALDFGYYRTIVINDIHMVRELYQMEASNGAPLLLGLELDRSPSGKPLGLITLDGEAHTEVLKLVRKSAKELTESIPVIDHVLLESTQFLIETFDAASKADEQISSDYCFYYATVNSVWRWITGERADPKDPTVSKIIEIALEFFKSLGPGHPSFFFPWICKLAPRLTGWTKIEHGNRQMAKHMEKSIENHQRTLHLRDQRMGNIMDIFEEAIAKTTNPSSPLYKELGYLNARATYVSLLYGGIETTASTISWAVLYMLKTPGAQEKLQREIDEVIGHDRRPSVADRQRMPYTMSFLNETFRISPAGPLGVPRRLIADLSFHGYHLRKDTIILPNIYGFHHDKSIWGQDADEFNAERFLNPDTSKTMLSGLLNFGFGKRSCPGEPIARTQVFFVFVAILQLFKFQADVENITSSGDLTKQSLKPFEFFFKVQRRTV